MILKGSVLSEVLEMETGITVVFPNDYKSGADFKVAYMLHGLYGSNGDWVNYTRLPLYANEKNVIFIMPDAVRSFYTDMKYGQKYFSYVTEELPKICTKYFNISQRREDTAVIGASMGGYGALKSALSKPGQYGYCCAFSSACLFLKEGMDYQRKYGESPEFVKQFGEQLIRDFFGAFGNDLEWSPEIEILELAKKTNSHPQKPKVFAAVGFNDHFYKDNIRFMNEMKMLNYDFIFNEWDGGHDWYFFDKALKKCLEIWAE